MLNVHEKLLIEKIKQAEQYAGKLELYCFDGKWYAMDYKNEYECAQPIEEKGLYKPLITVEEAELKNVDVIKCCDICDVYYVA